MGSNILKLHANETPLVDVLNQLYYNYTLHDLEALYYHEFGHVDKWTLFSDYSFDKNKKNHVITFSFLPYIIDPFKLGELIKNKAPKDIKSCRTVAPEFADFLATGPFLNFVIILSNYKYQSAANYTHFKNAILYTLDRMIAMVPVWDKENPKMKSYNKSLEKQFVRLKSLVSQDKKTQILNKLLLICTVGGFLSMLICNRTKTKIFGWFSDRDAIHDLVDNFSVHLFQIIFIQYLENPKNCQYLASPATSQMKPWYDELLKVPDYLTGAIADYDFENHRSTHKKFDTLISQTFTNNITNIFIYDLDFHNGKAPLTGERINFEDKR